MAYNDNFKEIFENLKDGDGLGFYKGGIFKHFIPAATGYECNHCGICYYVERNENEIKFRFSEQTFSGGKFDWISIYKINNNYITDDAYFTKQNKIYYRSLKVAMTPEQIARGREDAEGQVGKVYGFLTLIFGLKFWNFMPSWLSNWLGKRLKNAERVCSQHVEFNYIYAGVLTPNFKKDPFKDPGEIMYLGIFKPAATVSNICHKI